MLFHKTPPFDRLTGLSAPFEGFGPVLDRSQDRTDEFCRVVAEARRRIRDVFSVAISDSPAEIADQLDILADSMWDDGWDPSTGDVNLFATDFGLVLTAAMIKTGGGSLVFRSESDLSHVSVWYQDRGVEAFPFHKVFKRLSSREGESIASFVSGI